MNEFDKFIVEEVRSWPKEWEGVLFYREHPRKGTVEFTVYVVYKNQELRLDYEYDMEETLPANFYWRWDEKLALKVLDKVRSELEKGLGDW